MIFIDSNIPMYLVGPDHPLKHDAERHLRRLALAREKLVTDVEVFQEILHRYSALRRLAAVDPAWSALEGVVDEVFAIEYPLVEAAKHRLQDTPELSARDALHTAVMESQGVERILSFDAGFDAVPGLTRLY